MTRLGPAVLSVLLALSLAGCAPYRAKHNLHYGPGARQTYDFYEPRVDVGGSPRPALLVIHGGGYLSGDKSWAKKVAERFCPLGWVVVGINYALAPAGRWPAQLEDALLALRHIEGPDTTWMRIRLPVVGLGMSAGAHLVAALHLQGPLAHAVGISGPWDLREPNAQLDPTLRALLGLEEGAVIPTRARTLLSPVSWARSEASMLLIHAKYDSLTPWAGAVRMKAAITAAGGQVKLIGVRSDSHGSAWKDSEVLWQIAIWLKARQ